MTAMFFFRNPQERAMGWVLLEGLWFYSDTDRVDEIHLPASFEEGLQQEDDAIDAFLANR